MPLLELLVDVQCVVLKIHSIPGQTQDLALPHPGKQRHTVEQLKLATLDRFQERLDLLLLYGMDLFPADFRQITEIGGIIADHAQFHGLSKLIDYKTSVLAAVSLTGQGHPCFLKIQISKLDTESVSAVTQQIICPGSEIRSDALGPFQVALRGAYVHRHQVLDKGSGGHTLISNMKAFLLRTYHVLDKKHLQSYFDEFVFRFNRRFWPNLLFPRLVCAVAASNILGYDDLSR